MFEKFAQHSSAATVNIPAFPNSFGAVAENMDWMFRDYLLLSAADVIEIPTLPADFGKAAKRTYSMFESFGRESSALKIVFPTLPAGFGAVAESVGYMYYQAVMGVSAQEIIFPAFPASFGENAKDFTGMFAQFGMNSTSTALVFPALPAGFGNAATTMESMFASFCKGNADCIINDIVWNHATLSAANTTNMFTDADLDGKKILVPKIVDSIDAFAGINTGMYIFLNAVPNAQGNIAYQENYVLIDFTDGITDSQIAIVPYNAQVNVPASHTRQGYAFDGWYTDSACTIQFDSATPITESMTIYAGWK
jgi:uncharacterized repeat protein (TIGR02543 family)